MFDAADGLQFRVPGGGAGAACRRSKRGCREFWKRTGTLARWLHRHRPRASGPLIEVNCVPFTSGVARFFRLRVTR